MLYDKCYMCDYYDESVDEELGDIYPICTKPHYKDYPDFCEEKEHESEKIWERKVI